MNEKSEIEKPKDKWARIIFIPLVGFVSTLLFDKGVNPVIGFAFVINICVCIFSTFILWQVNRYIVILLRNKFPDYKQIANRLLWQILLCTIFSLSMSNIIFTLLQTAFPLAQLCFKDRLLMSQTSLIITFLIIAIYESAYFFGKWKTALIHTEELKRENVVS